MAQASGRLFDVSVRFPVTVTWVIGGLVAALTVIYGIVTWDLSDTLVFFGASLVAGGTLLSAFYTGRTLNHMLVQQEKVELRQTALDTQGRKMRTMDYGARWNAPPMHYNREACRKVFELRGRPAAEVSAALDADKPNVVQVMNFLEELAIARENDLIDEEMIRAQFAGIVTGVWQIMQPWVNDLRAARGRPQIGEKLEALARAWR